jgi:hypothetical protein
MGLRFHEQAEWGFIELSSSWKDLEEYLLSPLLSSVFLFRARDVGVLGRLSQYVLTTAPRLLGQLAEV